MISMFLIRNFLATLISVLFIAFLYWVGTVPEYLAILAQYKVVAFPVILFLVNLITKLTTWKGDDSWGAWVVKDLRRKAKV